MKRWIVICLGLVLSACTPYMYGVPQTSWDAMSPQERQQTMRMYEDEQRARQQAAEERGRQAAFERERQQARQAEEERRERERIEAIHRGEGAYGELLRVRIQGGEMRIGDRYRHYQPFSFRIAEGETRMIDIADRRGGVTGLLVTYTGGALLVDDPGGAGQRSALRLPYDRRWGGGMLYPDSRTNGPLQLRGVDIFVEIAGKREWGEREAPPQIIVVREEDRRRPEPPVVIVREEERRPEPPVVIIKEEKRRPDPPVVIVREEERRRPEPPPVVVVREDKARPYPGDERHDPRYDRKPAPPMERLVPARVEIQFLKGVIRRWGEVLPVEPFSVSLADGESREIEVKTRVGTYPVTLSYREGAVVIDGNLAAGKGKGNAARLPFEREWRKGRVYRIDTKGRLNLDVAEVRIMAVDGR
jgi:hypothetical protein